MRRLPAIVVLAAGGAAFAACGGGGEGSDPTPTNAPASVSSATPSASAPADPRTSPISAGQTVTPTEQAATTEVPAGTPAATATPTATAPAATPTSAPAQAPTPITPATQPPPPPPTAPPVSANPTSASVGVSGTSRFFWSPSAVTIAPGGTVTWNWTNASQPHNVAVAGVGVSGINKTDSVTFAFPEAGTYSVICEIHDDTMRGTVTVQ